MPFKATNNAVTGAPTAAPNTLGTVPSQVLTETGAVWGDVGGVSDVPSWITARPATVLPFLGWATTTDDAGLPADWGEQLAMRDALQSTRVGHAFTWTVGEH